MDITIFESASPNQEPVMYAQYTGRQSRKVFWLLLLGSVNRKTSHGNYNQITSLMNGTSERNYKTIQRFLNQVDLKTVLLRLYQKEAEFMIGDPTEMLRHRAPKTD